MSTPSDFDGLAAQLEHHLAEYHEHRSQYIQRQTEIDGRHQVIDGKHAELHRYVAKLVDFEQNLDRKIERGTRAIESLAISYGKQLDAMDDLRGEFKQMKVVIAKIARKLGA